LNQTEILMTYTAGPAESLKPIPSVYAVVLHHTDNEGVSVGPQ